MKGCRHKDFVFWVFSLKHLISLCGKFQCCGTSSSSFSAKNAKKSQFSLKKLCVAKYWYYFTF